MKININGVLVEVDSDALKTAIEENKDSFDVSSDDFVIRTATDNETFLNNLRSEEKLKGEQIGRKELFQKLELDIEGTGAHKSVDKSVEFVNTWASSLKDTAIKEANIEPNKKVKELQNDINTLKGTINTLTGEKTELQNSFETYKKDITVKSTLSSHIPDNAILPKDDMLMILGAKIKTSFDESGKLVALDETGNIKKDATTLNPVSIKDEVNLFFKNNPNYLKSTQGGAAGGDSGGSGGKQSIEDFTKEMIDAGHTPNGVEFNQIMEQRIKDGKLDI